MQTKTEKDKRKPKKVYPEKFIQEVKESIEDYKNGKYIIGDAKDIMEAIREYDKNKTDYVLQDYKKN
ncbi:MAG: hypothetical protein ABI550_07890 [Ignavibacteriaceae bacterium]